MKYLILNRLPSNYSLLSFKDKKFVLQSIKDAIKANDNNLRTLLN